MQITQMFAQETTEKLFHHLHSIIHICLNVPINIYIKSNTDLHLANTSSGSTPVNATDSRIRHSKSPNWQR